MPVKGTGLAGSIHLVLARNNLEICKMKYSKKWDQAYDDRNREALSELVDTDFHFIRHLTGEKIPRERILDMWATQDRVVIRSQSCL